MAGIKFSLTRQTIARICSEREKTNTHSSRPETTQEKL